MAEDLFALAARARGLERIASNAATRLSHCRIESQVLLSRMVWELSVAFTCEPPRYENEEAQDMAETSSYWD